MSLKMFVILQGSYAFNANHLLPSQEYFFKLERLVLSSQMEGIGPRIANDIWRENNEDEEIPLLNCDTLECLW